MGTRKSQRKGREMIQREYITEYDEYSHCIKYSITISTDNVFVFKTIKAYVESVCENEDVLNFAKMQAKAVIQNEID